jgi:hypothetical protein
MTSAVSALFEGLPEAPGNVPPPPDAPGGSGGEFDTATWRPKFIETFEGYVTLQTAAELFDVQRERLQVACWRGSLPGKKVGTTGVGQWFVHPGDVARYLATTLRGVTNRRKADELSPTRAERERQRLLASAEAAEKRAQKVRAQLEQLAQDPKATPADRANRRLREQREQMYVKGRRRVAAGLARQQRDLAEAAARAQALPHDAA